VETDLKIPVRCPFVAMEVAGLWGHNMAGGRSEREARRDECEPVVH